METYTLLPNLQNNVFLEFWLPRRKPKIFPIWFSTAAAVFVAGRQLCSLWWSILFRLQPLLCPQISPAMALMKDVTSSSTSPADMIAVQLFRTQDLAMDRSPLTMVSVGFDPSVQTAASVGIDRTSPTLTSLGFNPCALTRTLTPPPVSKSESEVGVSHEMVERDNLHSHSQSSSVSKGLETAWWFIIYVLYSSQTYLSISHSSKEYGILTIVYPLCCCRFQKAISKFLKSLLFRSGSIWRTSLTVAIPD